MGNILADHGAQVTDLQSYYRQAHKKPQAQEASLIHARSSHSAVATLQRPEIALRARGLTVFAMIRFSEDATRAGLSVRFTLMAVYGNPHAGTPVMIAEPHRRLRLVEVAD
jgi:uncharacterized protein (DUF302 family)